MRYLCEKTAIYKNVRVLYGNIKLIFYFFKIPRVRINLTKIRLIVTHVTLAHATFSNRGTARFGKRKTSCSDRLASSSRNYSIEESVRSRVFAGEADKKG
jgi:hypothetical protein